MRVLVLYAHPVETSFNAALHDGILAGLLMAATGPLRIARDQPARLALPW